LQWLRRVVFFYEKKEYEMHYVLWTLTALICFIMCILNITYIDGPALSILATVMTAAAGGFNLGFATSHWMRRW